MADEQGSEPIADPEVITDPATDPIEPDHGYAKGEHAVLQALLDMALGTDPVEPDDATGEDDPEDNEVG